MALYTVLISRNLSAVEGKPNGKPVGRVIQLRSGDRMAEFDGKTPDMTDIFYWKTVELTDAQRVTIIDAICTPQFDENAVEIVPKKNVDLDCFDAGEITTLSARGTVADGLGGTITNSNFIITNA